MILAVDTAPSKDPEILASLPRAESDGPSAEGRRANATMGPPPRLVDPSSTPRQAPDQSSRFPRASDRSRRSFNSMAPPPPPFPREPRARALSGRPFADTVLMCGKCIRRLGPAGKALGVTLKETLAESRWRGLRLKKAPCCSLCPHGGLVLATVRKPGDRRLVVLRADSPVEPALDYLLRQKIVD